jgi:hypothetical protein
VLRVSSFAIGVSFSLSWGFYYAPFMLFVFLFAFAGNFCENSMQAKAVLFYHDFGISVE